MLQLLAGARAHLGTALFLSGSGVITRQTPLQSAAPTAATQIRLLQQAQGGLANKLGLWLVLVFLFIAFSRVLDFSFNQLHLPMIVSTLALLAVVINGGLFRSLSSKLGLVLICLTLWMALSVPLSLWRGGSFSILVDDWSRCFLLFPVVGGVLISTAQVGKAIRCLAFALFTFALLTFTNGVIHSGRLEMKGSLFANSNDIAMAMAMGLFCWWSFYRSSNAFAGIAALMAQIVMLLVLVKTGSRGSLIALILTLPLLIAQYSTMGRLRLIIGLCIGAVLVSFLAPGSMISRFTVIFSPDEEVQNQTDLNTTVAAVGSTESRMYLLRRSLEVTWSHPIVGVGLGNFMVAENDKAKAEGRRGNWHGTHNTYTQLSSEAGIPAALFYLALFVLGWRALNRVKASIAGHPRQQEILTSVATLKLLLMFILAVGCFGHFAYLPFLTTLLGLIYGLSYSSQAEMNLLKSRQPVAKTIERPVPTFAYGRVQPNVWNRRLS